MSRMRSSIVVKFELQRLEDLGVGEEGDRRAGLGGRLALDHVRVGLAAREALPEDVAVAADLCGELLRQRVDDRQADAVQAAGHLVAAAVAELAAGVQDGEHDLERGALLLLHDRDRDPAAVVGDRDRVVGMDRHGDRRAAAGQRLVDRVVDDLVDEMVQAALARGADVHAGTLADGLEALQDGDVLGVVTGFTARVRARAFVVRQRSSDDVETPRYAAPCEARRGVKNLYNAE